MTLLARQTNNRRQFWMVKGAGPATVTHESRALAEDEARRLAAIHPGTAFYVMEAVAYHISRTTERHAFDRMDEDGQVPF